MPKISIITPIYKTEQYLEKCLNSLISQTLDDIEFIWIDNGASYICKNIISKYKTKHKNIKIIHLDKNIGYGRAMNIGLHEAKGQYIGFCDSDDWIDKDFYEKLYSATNDQKIDIAYAEYKLEFVDYSVPVYHKSGADRISTLKEKIQSLRNGAMWDKIFKREIIIKHKICFPEQSKSYFEDNIFLLKSIYYANSIIKIKSVYYHYLQHNNSTIHNSDKIIERETNKIDVISNIINFAIRLNFSAEEKLELLSFLNRSVGLYNLLKQKKSFNVLLNKLNNDKIFNWFLLKIYKAHSPSLIYRIFSINNDFKQNIIWILGIKIKLKIKEKI